MLQMLDIGNKVETPRPLSMSSGSICAQRNGTNISGQPSFSVIYFLSFSVCTDNPSMLQIIFNLFNHLFDKRKIQYMLAKTKVSRTHCKCKEYK